MIVGDLVLLVCTPLHIIVLRPLVNPLSLQTPMADTPLGTIPLAIHNCHEITTPGSLKTRVSQLTPTLPIVSTLERELSDPPHTMATTAFCPPIMAPIDPISQIQLEGTRGLPNLSATGPPSDVKLQGSSLPRSKNN